MTYQRRGDGAVTAKYITKAEVAAYEAKGWRVLRLDAPHCRYYLAWREDD